MGVPSVTSCPASAQLLLNEAATYTATTPTPEGYFGNILLDVTNLNGHTHSVLVGTTLSGNDNMATLDAADGTVTMLDASGRIEATATCDSGSSTPYIIAGVPGFDAPVRGGPPSTNTGVVRMMQINLNVIAEWDQEDWAGETLENGDQFGSSLATGDFNGDGYCDVAIGAPYEDDGVVVDAGAVYLVYGPLSSIPTFEGPITQATSGIATSSEEGDRFGEVLARGPRQFGRDSLLVGGPREDWFSSVDTGVVWWIPGSSTGLDPDAAAFWLLGQLMVPTDGDERFGSAFAVGDFNGDGSEDIAIGAPDNGTTSGAVAVFESPFLATPDLERTYLISPFDFPTTSGSGTVTGHSFGATLAAAEWTGDDPDELLIGAPGSQVGAATTAGAVYWSRGAVGGRLEPQVPLVQGDLPGQTSEPGDRFGDSLLVAQPYLSDARALVIGVPNEVLGTRGGDRGSSLNEGVVHVIPTPGRQITVSTVALESFGCGPLPVCDFIESLGDPAVDADGDIAFTGVQYPGEGFVMEAPLEQAYGGAAYQFGDAVAISPQGHLLAFESSGGERLLAFDAINGERTLAEVGVIDGDLEWLTLGPFQLDASGSAYLFAEAFLIPAAGATRGSELVKGIFRSSSLQPGSFSSQLQEGDAVGGNGNDTVLYLRHSLDVAHNGSSAAAALLGPDNGNSEWGLVIDDEVVWRQSYPVDGTVVDEAINLFAINATDWVIGLANSDLLPKVFDQNGILFANDGQVSGRALVPMEAESMALNDAGDLVVVWEGTSPDGFSLDVEEFVTLSCADGSPPRVLLAQGDRVDSGYGAATVVELARAFDTRPERTPRGTVVLHTRLWFDAGGKPLDAVLEIDAACPVFYDGFESGDVLSWSASVP